jgi:hypothetical protein
MRSMAGAQASGSGAYAAAALGRLLVFRLVLAALIARDAASAGVTGWRRMLGAIATIVLVVVLVIVARFVGHGGLRVTMTTAGAQRLFRFRKM